MREQIKDAQRIVIKVGSSTLTHDTGKMNLSRAERLSMVISDVANSGRCPVLVSSGAVALGVAKLGIMPYPVDIEVKQAAAAVGQCELMSMYEQFFGVYGKNIAQILLTKDVLQHEERRRNAKNTFENLLSLGVIPVVNENDSVSFEGIKFGGNDTLAADVALIIGADLLINLSDVDGLYTKNPKEKGAKYIPVVEEITTEIEDYADGGGGSIRGVGGMKTKLSSARLLTENGIAMVIANGAVPEIIYAILEGREAGTLFVPKIIRGNL